MRNADYSDGETKGRGDGETFDDTASFSPSPLLPLSPSAFHSAITCACRPDIMLYSPKVKETSAAASKSRLVFCPEFFKVVEAAEPLTRQAEVFARRATSEGSKQRPPFSARFTPSLT